MNALKNVSIRGKIMIILFLVIALEFVVVLSALHFLDAVSDRTNQIVEVDVEKIKLAGGIQKNLLEIHRAQKNLIMALSRQDAEYQVERLHRHQGELSQWLARLEGLTDEEEFVLMRQFSDHYGVFLRINDEIEALVLQNRDQGMLDTEPVQEAGYLNPQAVRLSIGSGREAYNRASESLATLVSKTDLALQDGKAESRRYGQVALATMLLLSLASIGVGLSTGFFVARSVSDNLSAMVTVADSIASGNLETPIRIDSRDETGRLAASVRAMQASLRRSRDEAATRDWLKTGVARLNNAMQGKVTLPDLCTSVVTEIASYLNAQVGALFLMDGDGREPVLKLTGGYAYSEHHQGWSRFKAGEGLVGQAALEGRSILVRDVPQDHIKVVCGLGETCPQSVLVSPFSYDGAVSGVIELGFLSSIEEEHLQYLEQAMSPVAINIETVRSREDLARALARAQALTEELQAQQDELKAINEELEEQTQQLEQSEERLKEQQVRLEESNRELEEKNIFLELQKKDIERANRQLEQTQQEIEEKAEQLAIASQYKSQFLANMSHELRTPLNSMLLLARMLSENKEGNLTEEQVGSAEIIYGSGNDLLQLINEILDLAKIESGHMDVHVDAVSIDQLAGSVKDSFEPLAAEKGLSLQVTVGEDCPKTIFNDAKRLAQIVRNLLSNAIKFTEHGSIEVRFSRPDPAAPFTRKIDLDQAVSIAVKDTGIGIVPEKQKVVFEAFQQAEGGIARKYGGTGLGLSISRELANLLGGEIHLDSRPGQGSTFTLLLPVRHGSSWRLASKAAPKALKTERPWQAAAPEPTAALPAIADDREALAEDDDAILIIEDDRRFMELLLRQCRDRGFKCLCAACGESGLELARKHLPKGIILDLNLPGMSGWKVLEELKENPDTRHIPIHIMSVEDATPEAMRQGAIGYLSKPATKEQIEEAIRKIEHTFSRPMKNLLVVEDDEVLRKSIIQVIGDSDVQFDEAADGRQALAALKSKSYDCMILDLGLPDMSGQELLACMEELEGVALPPVIVYTGRALTREEEIELRNYSESIIIKGARSDERLLDEASLFLHRAIGKMPEKKREIIRNLHDVDAMFQGRRVLIVDDDMRNVFALSRVLQEKGIKTLKAENGARALEVLDQNSEVDLVLMDIMMPIMDGYEAIGRIRDQARFKTLPIIALTAKAMSPDRERCIAAGANDYLAKPVDTKRLFSMMRVWMYR